MRGCPMCSSPDSQTSLAKATWRTMKKQIRIITMLLLVLGPTTSFAQYTDTHDFDCFNEGCNPQPPGILAQGRDGKLYGSNGSRLFNMPPYHTLHTFNFGNFPEPGGLTLGTDGYFYGTTNSGVTSNL